MRWMLVLMTTIASASAHAQSSIPVAPAPIAPATPVPPASGATFMPKYRFGGSFGGTYQPTNRYAPVYSAPYNKPFYCPSPACQAVPAVAAPAVGATPVAPYSPVPAPVAGTTNAPYANRFVPGNIVIPAAPVAVAMRNYEDENPWAGLDRLRADRQLSTTSNADFVSHESKLRIRCLLLTLKECSSLIEQRQWAAAARVADRGARLSENASGTPAEEEARESLHDIKKLAEALVEAEKQKSVDEKAASAVRIHFDEHAATAYARLRNGKGDGTESDDDVLAELEILLDRRLTGAERTRAVRMNWQGLTVQSILSHLRASPLSAFTSPPIVPQGLVGN